MTETPTHSARLNMLQGGCPSVEVASGTAFEDAVM